MKNITFAKASLLKAEIVAIKRKLSEITKFGAFTTNHKNHKIVIRSHSKETGIELEIQGVLTSKDTVEVSQVIEKRLVKRLKKLNKKFKKL
ncbi:MAG: hypothetical protein HRT41_02195 [Campylobacteraceae bacterium]|nr:hypothetical protein [Campylobacteraceae bacterium]